MPYEITAIRTRPQDFEDLAGQDFVKTTLEASLESGRIAHAYLFSGPRGCGKTSTARILAKALNCEKGPGAKTCGICASCVSITAGSSLDVIEIDGASNTSVDNVRQIKDEVLFPPNGGRYKIYIIDEVHMLSMSAFNALLKTIEEPPPYVIFIFATTELHKVPATIKSRCQQFAFRLFPVEIIKTLLAVAAKEMSVIAEDEALLWIAKESGGSLRDAYTLFDQVVAFSEGTLSAAKIREKLGLVGLDAMNGLFESLVSARETGSAAAALEALDGFLARGVSIEQFVIDAIDYLRSLLLLKNGMGRESLIGAPASAYSAAVLDALDSERIERGLGLFFELHRNLRMSPNPRFELELAVTRLSRLREHVSPSELASAVAELKRGLSSGALPASGREEVPRPQSRPASSGEAPHRHSSSPSVEAEKKKPELKEGLPASLTSAFSSLAGAVLGTSQPDMAIKRGLEPAGRLGESRDAETRGDPEARASKDEEAAESEEDEDAKADPIFASDEEIAIRGETQGSSGGSTIEAEGEAAGAATGIAAFKREVIARVGRANPLLGSGLASSLEWVLEEERLLIPFRNAMEEHFVRGEISVLAAAAAAIAGRSIKVELKISGAGKAAKAAAAAVVEGGTLDPVTLVERMFRGQRIEGRKRGGNDELR
jgi:DNA polymerase III subunit gamma/tau